MADESLPCTPDEAVLNDPANEESDAFEYWINATAHLLNVLHADSNLRGTALHGQLLSLIAFWDAKPEERNNEKAMDAFLDLAWFGAVGRALWHLRGSKDAQLRLELERLATDPEVLVGNQYLFYIAGTLAAKGYAIEFVPEKGKHGKKTPDLKASKSGKSIWIEANAKQPKRVIDTPERLWQLIRDIIAEKKQKFTDPAYAPGMIVADISTAYHLVNETGTAPVLKLRGDLCKPLGKTIQDGFVYPLYADPDWHKQPENQGNVFAYLVDEFAAIDRAKYHVAQCLITITRRVWRDGRQVAFPKGHQLIVHRSVEPDAMLDLSRHVYVVG
jgi:hypothetical protein